MRNIVLRIIPILILAPPLWAQEDSKDKAKSDKPPTPAEQFQAMVKEIQASQREAGRALRQAKTAEERQKILDDFHKKPQAYVGRFLELAVKNPKEPFAFDALGFVAMNGSGPELDKAIDLLIKDHSDKLADLLSKVASQSESPGVEKLLRVFVQKITDHALSGQASFSLGQLLQSKSESTTLNPDEASKLATEAENLFDRVVKDFADVKDLADQAKGELFVLRNLSVGKAAPDLSGEDGDSKKFKLSDYRGKVVVLDFWANW
jgi:hypothetical protein